MFHFMGGAEPQLGPSTNPSLAALKAHDTKLDKRQITRNRRSYSCLTCRRRKVKCDKVHPVCGGCEKANEECLYSIPEYPQDAQDGADPSNHNVSPDVKKRKNSPTQDVSAVSPANRSTLSGSVASLHIGAIEEQLQRLSALVDALRGYGTMEDSTYLRNLLTPADQDTGGGPTHRNLGIGMFQPQPNGLLKDTSELSKPLASLKLSIGEKPKTEDPFWNYVSDELNQLNDMMRRQNKYVSATNIQNESCPGRIPETLEQKAASKPLSDDMFDPNSFQKEAGLQIPAFHSAESSCPVCKLMPFTKSTLLQDIPVRCSAKLGKEHLLKHIPLNTQSNVLFRCWLSGVHALVPVLMPREAQRLHEEFWLQYHSRSAEESWYPDLGSAAVLYAIWYSASLSISKEGLERWFPGTTRAELSARFHDQVVFALHLSTFSRSPTLQTIAAFTIICSLPVSEEDPTQASLYLQLIVRLSLTMGLHREPTLFNIPVAEQGMRRRLWWHIIQLDIAQVVTSGYPSLISEAYCDTRIICEDQDAITDRDSPNSGSEQTNSQESSDGSRSSAEDLPWESYRSFSLVARGKSIISCAFRAIASIHMSITPMSNGDLGDLKRTMATAGQEINAIIKQIPVKGLPEMGFNPAGSKDRPLRFLDCENPMATPVSPSELGHYTDIVGGADGKSPLNNYYHSRRVAYNKWARINLSMMIDKLHCVAYAPFLKNTRSKMWSVGRQCALHNCHSFLRKFLSLVDDPELEPFRWSWPAMYGPMHAALIVLVDLYERPGSVEAPRSRELIDQVFAFCRPEREIVGGPYGVTVQRPMREGGVEAWDMLRALRSASWQKAGLDPRVLWSEADEIDIGFAKPLTDAQRLAQSLREDALLDNSRGLGRKSSKSHCVERADGHDTSFSHMLSTAHNESVEPIEHEGKPCSKAIRDRFFRHIENDDRLNPMRGLAWKSNQQKMPFPLSPEEEQACTGAASQGDHDASHVLHMNAHLPTTAGRSTSCGRQHDASCGPTTSLEGSKIRIDGLASPVSQDAWPPASSTAPSNHATLPAVAPEGYFSTSNGWSNDVPGSGTRNLDAVHHTRSNGGGNSAHAGGQSHLEASQNDSELGFDWDRWDSVFGQYTGFTDMMQDVRWQDYVED